MRDLRLALRFLLKKPGWVAAAVLTVAIGIAGSTLAFSLVDRALWRPLGFADGGELITLYARSGVEYSTIAWPDYVAFRDVLHDDGEGPADLAAFVRTFSTVGGGEFPELHEGELVSGNFFSVLRVQPFLGRIIAPSDNVAPGAHSVIVLSHMLWRTQFASDPDVVGRDLLLDGRRFEVIGVAPPGFRGPVWPSFESAFWIPALMAAEEFGVIACIVIIALFGFIVLRGFARTLRGGDLFSVIAVTGLLAQFGFQALINMGVAIRLLPAKGMTLPFLSYGGSSTMATAIGLGMVLALTRERWSDEGYEL